MTVLLVILTFATFLVIDYFLSQKRAAKQPLLYTVVREARPVSPVVAGFEVPANLRYHPGHTWALSESPDRVRVGMDDFAGKLIGKVERIGLAERGRWIRQGQKLATIFRDGKSVDMVSPIEGTISDVNEAVVKNPALASKDPYGEGWLVAVQSPDAKTNFRNLLGGALARVWMEESALRLQSRIPALAGALAQDGGVATDDLTSHMPDQDWTEVTKEFFLS
jgi:glycine cleavage system H lipoate-binding protein